MIRLCRVLCAVLVSQAGAPLPHKEALTFESGISVHVKGDDKVQQLARMVFIAGGG
jgi:hypothetical protein